MIVFGDTRRRVAVAELVAAVRAPDGPGAASLDDLRLALVRAGCLEQAVHDGADAGCCPLAAVADAVSITDLLADAFVAAVTGRPAGAQADRAQLEAHLASVRAAAGDAQVDATTPEGFRCYTLFPEQYVEAARRWDADQLAGHGADVLVLGLRSIGTTLSAVVRATLAGLGRQARRTTVRPFGAPFAREVRLGRAVVGSAVCALVVDEGPGLSGSSMAAAVDALVGAGLDPSRIGLLPGHGGGPGAMSPPQVREVWHRTRQWVASLGELRWAGRSLPELLADHTERLTGASVVRVDDVSGGGWRHAAGCPPSEWPAVCSTFERTKYRCATAGGAAILWRFAGDDATLTRHRLDARAALGWSPPPVAAAHGFVAVPWVDGAPLRAADATDGVLRGIGAFVDDVSGPALAVGEHLAAIERLGEMLVVNVAEGLGADAADHARAWGDAAHDRIATPGPTYGDGRMAPHAWRRDGERLTKLGGVGSDRDHTVVGAQSVAWDVAGAIVEWDLDRRQAAVLLGALPRSAAAAADPVALRFHELAYAAFRLGQTTMSVGMTTDTAEQERLRVAAGRYREQLVRRLTRRAPAARRAVRSD